jgi:hypothetical protein
LEQKDKVPNFANLRLGNNFEGSSELLSNFSVETITKNR